MLYQLEFVPGGIGEVVVARQPTSARDACFAEARRRSRLAPDEAFFVVAFKRDEAVGHVAYIAGSIAERAGIFRPVDCAA